MKPPKIVDTTLLEKALGAAALRQEVISSNIANINTPGFDAQRVVFESHLREVMAMDKAEDDGFNVASAVDPEFRLDSGGGFDARSLRPTIESQGGPMDVNQEMSNLAKNQIMYNALTSKISGVYGALKYIIDSSGR